MAQHSVRETVKREEEEYESRLLIFPEALHLGNATASTPGRPLHTSTTFPNRIICMHHDQ